MAVFLKQQNIPSSFKTPFIREFLLPVHRNNHQYVHDGGASTFFLASSGYLVLPRPHHLHLLWNSQQCIEKENFGQLRGKMFFGIHFKYKKNYNGNKI